LFFGITGMSWIGFVNYGPLHGAIRARHSIGVLLATALSVSDLDAALNKSFIFIVSQRAGLKACGLSVNVGLINHSICHWPFHWIARQRGAQGRQGLKPTPAISSALHERSRLSPSIASLNW